MSGRRKLPPLPPGTTPEERAIAHSLRFRAVSNGYPRRVALAYGGPGDGALAAAAADSDEQVAARVAAWLAAQDQPSRRRQH